MLKGIALNPLSGVSGESQLVVVYAETSAGRQVRLSYPDYQRLREQACAFAGLFGSSLATVNIGRGPEARQIWSALVTGDYFSVLGVRAQLGRTLLPQDELAPGGHPVVVISDALWRRDFAADPDVLGRTLLVNNHAFTVVGVADPAFHGTIISYDVEAFVPIMMAAQIGILGGVPPSASATLFSDQRAVLLFPHGYLKSGATLSDASAEIDAISADLSRGRGASDTAQTLRIVPYRQSPIGAQTFILPTLAVLTLTALLVLMVACANVAGLVLVRGVSRRGEIALRLALGATRVRIVRLLVIENLVLAVPGAVLGVLVAQTGIPLLVRYAEWLAAPSRLFFNIDVDGLVIGYSGLVACGSALLFGFVPALRSSRVDLVGVINEDASPRGAARARLRGGLVVAQVAVSLLLLVGAGLTTRSVEAARRANPGFVAENVSAVELDVKQNGHDRARGRAFYRELLEAVSADPGVDAAALAAYTPMGMTETRSQSVSVDGYEPRRGEDLAFMSNTVTPAYFHTLRIPILAGQSFDQGDDETSAPVVIVNRALAQRFWGGASNAVGKRLRVADGEWRTVVGVAADLKYARIDEAPRPYFYLPFEQAYRSGMTLHTRGTAGVDTLVQQARAHVASLDPDLPVVSARPLADQIRGAFVFLDLTATMLLLFGSAGMALAAIGTYGVVSYTVKQSTHEIGIRLALGASSRSVVAGFVFRGLRLGGIGAVVGTIAALSGAGLLRSVLFGVSVTDPHAFAGALIVVLTGVLLATLIPAWRASRTSPLSALRHQ
jgi:predicted permease